MAVTGSSTNVSGVPRESRPRDRSFIKRDEYRSLLASLTDTCRNYWRSSDRYRYFPRDRSMADERTPTPHDDRPRRGGPRVSSGYSLHLVCLGLRRSAVVQLRTDREWTGTGVSSAVQERGIHLGNPGANQQRRSIPGRRLLERLEGVGVWVFLREHRPNGDRPPSHRGGPNNVRREQRQWVSHDGDESTYQPR